MTKKLLKKQIKLLKGLKWADNYYQWIKICNNGYNGQHFLGSRFLRVPNFEGVQNSRGMKIFAGTILLRDESFSG